MDTLKLLWELSPTTVIAVVVMFLLLIFIAYKVEQIHNLLRDEKQLNEMKQRIVFESRKPPTQP